MQEISNKNATSSNATSSGSTIKTETGQSSQKRRYLKVNNVSDSVSGTHVHKFPCNCDECSGKQFIKEDPSDVENTNINQQIQLRMVSADKIKHEDDGSHDTLKIENDSVQFKLVTTAVRRSLRVAANKSQVRYVPPSENDFEETNDDYENRSGPEHESASEADVYESNPSPSSFASEKENTSEPATQDDCARLVVLSLHCPIDGCNAKAKDKKQLETHLIKNHKVKPFRCLVSDCEKSFNDRKSLIHHRNGHKQFKCSECGHSLPNYSRLFIHYYQLHEAGLYGCSRCDFVFDGRRNKVQKHLLTHKNRTFKCTVDGCGKELIDARSLRYHMKSHSKKALLFYCSICKGGYRTNEALSAHKCPDVLYRCRWPECGHTTQYRTALGSHIRTKHFHLPSHEKEQREKGIVDNRDWTVWMERVCSDGVTKFKKPSCFYADGTLEEANFSPPATPEHVPDLFSDDETQENDTDENNEQAQQQPPPNDTNSEATSGDESDFSTDSTDSDMTGKRPAQRKSRNQKKIFHIVSLDCHKCQTTLDGKKALYKHLFEKHGINKYRCQVKGCRFSGTCGSALTYHCKQKHARLSEWPCGTCENTFSTYYRLTMHCMNVHAQGQFKCAYPNCTLITPTRSSIHGHSKTHQQFICSVTGCRKIFHEKSNLRGHMRSCHTNERPYKCEQCGKTFAVQACLRSHRPIHDIIKKLMCTWPDCTYKTSKRNLLIRHIRNVHFNHCMKRRKPHLKQIYDQDVNLYIAKNDELPEESNNSLLTPIGIEQEDSADDTELKDNLQNEESSSSDHLSENVSPSESDDQTEYTTRSSLPIVENNIRVSVQIDNLCSVGDIEDENVNEVFQQDETNSINQSSSNVSDGQAQTEFSVRRSMRIASISNKTQTAFVPSVAGDSEADTDEDIHQDDSETFSSDDDSEDADDSEESDFFESSSEEDSLTWQGKPAHESKRSRHHGEYNPALRTKCPIEGCGRQLRPISMKYHLKSHTREGLVFQCDNCREKFRSKAQRQAHECAKVLWRCTWPDCQFRFKLPNHVRNHVKSRHLNDDPERDAEEWLEKIDSDGNVLSTKLAHFIADGTLVEADFSPPATPEHVPNLFDDENDEQSTDSQTQADVDLESEASHGKAKRIVLSLEEKQIKVNFLQCYLCDAQCPNQKKLLKHLGRQHQVLRLPCYLKGCNASFADPFGMSQHRKKHAKLKQWQCCKCSETFRNCLALSRHFALKHIMGSYECNFGGTCGLTFDTRDGIDRHRLTHNQFICPVKGCRKVYQRRSQFNAHTRTHTNEKLYKCTDCDKVYSQSTSLYHHRYEHAAVKRYRCTWPDCEYEHCIRSRLALHINKAHFRLYAAKRKSSLKRIRDQDPGRYIAKNV